MGRRKLRKCRICKKSPVWRGGDVKHPGPYCKRCYHKHVWSGGKGSGQQKADELSERTEDGSIEAEELGKIYPDPWVDDLFDCLPESTDDDEMIPF